MFIADTITLSKATKLHFTQPHCSDGEPLLLLSLRILHYIVLQYLISISAFSASAHTYTRARMQKVWRECTGAQTCPTYCNLNNTKHIPRLQVYNLRMKQSKIMITQKNYLKTVTI